MAINQIAMTALFGLVGLFLGLVITRLWDYLWKPFKVDEDMVFLRSRMSNLKARSNDVQVQIKMAELEHKTCINEVKWWLEKVELIDGDVDDIEAEYSDWRSSYLGFKSYLHFWKRISLSYKVFKKLREVTELRDQGAFKDVAAKLPPPAAQEMPSTPRVRAMDSKRDQILCRLDNDYTTDIIGIWGMGGVGKTTLLKMINNYFARIRHPSFDHVIFVLATKNVNLQELQKKILDNLRLPTDDYGDMNSRATILFNFLREKKVLVLLDDLWNYVNLVHLGIPLGQGKCCKVIFTTRSEEVCGSMKANTKLKVECLKEKEAWSLFEENVGENIINSHPTIRQLAEEVAKECCGLPLALITIGRAMSTKKTWRQWQDALNMLCSSRPYDILGVPDTMFPILEFSYQDLQNKSMRECFLSCSMWPEDHSISKDDLILCWMGLNLIDDCNEINEAYDRGHSIIESLKCRCLLECGEEDEVIKMHDVLRDLALWIASDHGENKNKWIVQAGTQLKECKTAKWKEAHRISLIHNDIESLPEQLPDCPQLLVLTLRFNRSKIVSAALLHCWPALTYLDLGWNPIQLLPSAIGELVNLRFLNLEHTRITYLPDELSHLVNLKYLNLEGTCVKRIPQRLLFHLPMLKMLDLYGCQIEATSFDVLKHLDGRLMGLGINIPTVSALRLLSMLSNISVVKLLLQYLVGTEYLELLSPALFGSKTTAGGLRSLTIVCCESLKALVVNTMQDGSVRRLQSLPRLEGLGLIGLPVLEKISWSGVKPSELLPSLRNLIVDGCPKLKNLSWVFHLPNLESLSLYSCDDIKIVIENARDDDGDGAEVSEDEFIPAFPNLKRLILNSLPNLSSICRSCIPFPSLESATVKDCPQLKKLPFKTLSIPSKLLEIHGSEEWWEHLEWEDDNIKTLLQDSFNPSC